MIYVVHFKSNNWREVVIAVFLLRSDAKAFICGSVTRDVNITEVDSWEAWSDIRKDLEKTLGENK
jgi:hypothetical protein